MDTHDPRNANQVVVEATEAGAIQIPGSTWLQQAYFVRQGPDLMLVGEDGQKVLIVDYFRLENPPELVAGNGAVFTHDWVVKLASYTSPAEFAQAGQPGAAEPIGRIETIKGVVEVTRSDGTQVTVQKGDPVYQGDKIDTGDGAAIGLVLADESVFSLDANGSIVLD